MKTRFLLTVVLLGLLLGLSACGPAALKADAAQPYLDFADPIADQLLIGLANNDYAAFSQDFAASFDSRLSAALTESNFTDMQAKLTQQLGKFEQREAGKVYPVEQNGTKFLTIVYPVRFEKATLAMRLTLNDDAEHKVSGLYFK